MIYRSLDDHWGIRLAGDSATRRVEVGSGVSEVMAAFVASLAGMSQHHPNQHRSSNTPEDSPAQRVILKSVQD